MLGNLILERAALRLGRNNQQRDAQACNQANFQRQIHLAPYVFPSLASTITVSPIILHGLNERHEKLILRACWW